MLKQSPFGVVCLVRTNPPPRPQLSSHSEHSPTLPLVPSRARRHEYRQLLHALVPRRVIEQAKENVDELEVDPSLDLDAGG